MIQGTGPFFRCTKTLHNMLQSEQLDLSDADKTIYEQVGFENALRLDLDDCDAVIVHHPQPLPLLRHFPERDMPWLWQCHIDLSSPAPDVWSYLRQFIDDYDAAIFSLPEYGKELRVDQRFIMPAIDPFSAKSGELSETEIAECLTRHRIPTGRPLVVQISRFDRWKDPLGVIAAFRKAREHVDCRLVLLGNHALDDPEGEVILETIRSSIDESIIVLTVDDPVLVNALQRKATVVLQKSLREGFGLTVTEAMWKGAAVIGGNVGGIRHQISDDRNGFLINSIDEAADRIVQLVTDRKLRERLAANAKETVRHRFLINRLLEDWIDVLAAYDRRGTA
jgi:trehalose synthase